MLEQLILDMYDVGMIKFGEFTLKSGSHPMFMRIFGPRFLIHRFSPRCVI